MLRALLHSYVIEMDEEGSRVRKKDDALPLLMVLGCHAKKQMKVIGSLCLKDTGFLVSV